MEQAAGATMKPLNVATHIREALKALYHASKVAAFCENVCRDMLATVCSRAPILCDLLALGTVYSEEHEQLNRALHASLKLALEAIDSALQAIYGFLMASTLVRLMHAQSTRTKIEEQRACLKSRFDDIQAHVQYATYLQSGKPLDSVREPVPAVEELRRELGALQGLEQPSKQEIMVVAAAMMERRKASGHRIPVLESVSSVDVSPDGKYIIVGGQGSKVNAAIHDAETGNRISTLKGHTRFVTCVAWSPDGKRCASTSHDTTAVIWDASTGKSESTLEGHEKWVNAAAWSPDSCKLATVSHDKRCIMWEIESGTQLQVLEGHSNWVHSVCWSYNGRVIATGSEDHTAVLWNADDGRRLRVLGGHSAWVRSLAFSPDSVTLATASGDDTAALWSADTGKRIRVLIGHSNWVTSVSWSPDGCFLVTGSDDDTTAVWSAFTGQRLHLFPGQSTLVNCVTWSPSGNFVYTASQDGAVRVYYVKSVL